MTQAEGQNRAARPRLLLAWGNPYTFDGSLVPLVPRLAGAYEVHVLMVDFHLTPRVTEQLRRWQAEGVITGFAIVPEYQDTWRLHRFMALEVRRLRRRNFDVLLTGSVMQVWERYLLACALPPQALRVCLLGNMARLLTHEALVRDLLGGKTPDAALAALAPPPAEPPPAPSVRRALRRIADTPGLAGRARLLWRYVELVAQRIRARLLPDVNNHDFLDRYLLPALLVGRTFPFGKFDSLTQLGTDQFDAAVFVDPLEARAYAALLGTPNTFVTEHPARGNCRCAQLGTERHAILSPLSGLMGSNALPDELLDLYRRDLGAALHASGAREVHLRLHPRETGQWPQQLAEYLRANGVAARIVDASRPVREVICEYTGVVGSVSASLRDARGSCDYAFVACMVAPSKPQFANPKFIFGAGEGIAWIEADGSFAAGAFERRRYAAPAHPPLTALLAELAARKRAGMLQRDVK